jgi:hypothetical protein
MMLPVLRYHYIAGRVEIMRADPPFDRLRQVLGLCAVRSQAATRDRGLCPNYPESQISLLSPPKMS